MTTTIVFSTSNSFVSRAIKWFTRSKVSHSMICTEWHGEPVLIHCTMGGGQVTPRAKWLQDNKLVAEYRFKPDMTEGIKHLIGHLNVGYDYPTLFGWGYVILAARWLRKKIKNPLNSPTAMVCSEFCMHIGQPELGPSTIPEWRGLIPDQTDCQMLIDHMSDESFEKVA